MRTIPIHKTLTSGSATALVWAGRCGIKSCLHTGDGVNDYEFVLYDCASASPAGTENQVYPKGPFEGDVFGLNGSEKNDEADCQLGACIKAFDIGGGAYSGGTINVTVEIIPG